MQRLTARAQNGMAYLTKVKPNEQEVESPYSNTLKCIMESIKRLAEYEETGLTPDEVTELQSKYKELKQENKELDEALAEFQDV